MTTAATSLLGLALPVQGELEGAWGDTVNNSVTSLLDTAIAGTTTLSADSDVTLSTTTLSSNQARQAIILWTASGTTTRYITAPAQSKTYVVINNTSGSQSIVIRGAGPTTGVTLAAGESKIVAWNGSDFEAIADITGTDITVSGITIKRGSYQRITFQDAGGTNYGLLGTDTDAQLFYMTTYGSSYTLQLSASNAVYGKIQLVVGTSTTNILPSGGINVGGSTDPGISAIAANGGITSYGGTAGIGYSTGAGGAVTQTTSRTTGVTLNKPTGAITLVSAAGSATYASFTVTNSIVAATDTVVMSQKSGTDKYEIFVTNVSAGSFQVTFRTTGGTTTEQPVFNFAVIKAVAS